MTPMITTFEKPTTQSNTLTASGARQAAMLASNIAGLAAQWSQMHHAGVEAASDAMEAAERARLMAECAAVATSESTIRALAADAWAAAQRAIAADRRVTLAIQA